MWELLAATVMLLIGSFAWLVWRDKKWCPVCEHAMSAHDRGTLDEGSLGNYHCRTCSKECR